LLIVCHISGTPLNVFPVLFNYLWTLWGKYSSI
jgi:hypothetical protein